MTNSVLEWHPGYLVTKADWWGQLVSDQSAAGTQKIDAAVALMMALGRAMTEHSNAGIDGFLSNPLVLQPGATDPEIEAEDMLSLAEYIAAAPKPSVMN